MTLETDNARMKRSLEEMGEWMESERGEEKRKTPQVVLVEDEDLLSNGLGLLDSAEKKFQAKMEELKHQHTTLMQRKETISKVEGDLAEYKDHLLRYGLLPQIEQWHAQVKSFIYAGSPSETFLIELLSFLTKHYKDKVVSIQLVRATSEWMREKCDLNYLKDHAKIKKLVLDLSNLMRDADYASEGTEERALIIAESLKSLVA